MHIVCKEFRFESAHFLPHVAPDHKCRRVHGHSYRVRLYCTGPLHAELGWVVDFGTLAAAFEPLRKQLCHHLLNDIEGLQNPTSELLARWIAEKMAPVVAGLADGLRLVVVEVSETETSEAKYIIPCQDLTFLADLLHTIL